jgi:hypothetical protein
VTYQCTDALALVPSYLDGELSEAQAAPLREHLLGCQPCRGSAQDLKGLKRWFVGPAEEASLVPTGFAARVARRAFAGDTGEADAPLPAAAVAPSLGFVRELTGIAAAVLVALAIGLRMQDRPAGERLQADQRLSFPEVQEQLERLNREDAAAAVKGALGERTAPGAVGAGD